MRPTLLQLLNWSQWMRDKYKGNSHVYQNISTHKQVELLDIRTSKGVVLLDKGRGPIIKISIEEFNSQYEPLLPKKPEER